MWDLLFDELITINCVLVVFIFGDWLVFFLTAFICPPEPINIENYQEMSSNDDVSEIDAYKNSSACVKWDCYHYQEGYWVLN